MRNTTLRELVYTYAHRSDPENRVSFYQVLDSVINRTRTARITSILPWMGIFSDDFSEDGKRVWHYEVHLHNLEIDEGV